MTTEPNGKLPKEILTTLDPKYWPKEYLICDGEVFGFVSDDPNEERVRRVLYQGGKQ
jgi:hypothetical protein